MARRLSKRGKPEASQDAEPDVPEGQPGLPPKDAVRDVVRFVSPQNEVYRILKTTEMDAYDKPAKPKAPRRKRTR